MSRKFGMFLALVLCVPMLMADDYEQNEEFAAPISGWDPTIRDNTEKCQNMAGYAKDENSYCAIFDMCCNMNYDKLNGDKCQFIQKSCIGPNEATCIWKNCTEMITTTTTTTTTPVPSVNSAGLLSGVASFGMALLLLR